MFSVAIIRRHVQGVNAGHTHTPMLPCESVFGDLKLKKSRNYYEKSTAVSGCCVGDAKPRKLERS